MKLVRRSLLSGVNRPAITLRPRGTGPGSGTWPSLVAYFGRMMQTATMPAAQRFPQLRASLFLFPLLLGSALHAQDDLVRVTSATATDSTGYRFTTVVSAEVTPVENQASSGTCWSYAANSFLESEMIK